MNNSYNKTNIKVNLIGSDAHRHFIEILAEYGIARSGGTNFSTISEKHEQRLVSDINLLSTTEKRKVIFAEAIFSN